MRKFNWDYIEYKIRNDLGYSIAEYCRVKLGKSERYLGTYKSQGMSPPQNIIDLMQTHMELNESALWQEDETKPDNITKQDLYEKLCVIERKLDELAVKESPLEKLLKLMAQ